MTKKDKKVKMSVPKGIEFGTPYSMTEDTVDDLIGYLLLLKMSM